MPVKLVLFDFGGVLAPEGFELGVLKLSKIFNISYDQMYKIAGWQAAQESGYSAGKITEDEYWILLAKLLNSKEDLKKYRHLFLENFIVRPDMIRLLEELKPKISLGIFSDQTDWIYELDKQFEFLKLFDHSFISYDLGYTKYDDIFYKIPSQKTGISPEEILVIDDKTRVIEKSKNFGMKGLLFTSISDCKGYLYKEGFL